MVKRLSFITALLLIICCLQVQHVMAQGRTIPRSSEVEAIDETLLEILPEGQRYRYPFFNGLNVSVDVFDPVMSLFFYNHASYEGQVMVDLYHRFFPMFSMGMGWADETSNNGIDFGTEQKQELRYKSDLAPFAKIGLGYNLDYNSIRPADYYILFMRYGYAYNTADISNLYYADDLWGAHGPLELSDQKYRTQWVEAGLMLRVQLMKRFAMGWDLYWKVPLSQSGTRYGKPSFVPGYGSMDTSLGFAFRLFYDIF